MVESSTLNAMREPLKTQTSMGKRTLHEIKFAVLLFSVY